MTEKSKLQTLSYVFLLTVVPQLVVWAMFLIVCYVAYWFSAYNSTIHAFIGIAAFIAMLFGFLCVAIFTRSYGLSLFAPTRRDFNVNDFHGAPVEKIDYAVGRKNVFTGRRSIYVYKREVPTGGPLLVTALMSIVIAITGICKFAIEAVRVCRSDDRQGEWEGCRAYLIDMRDKEGAWTFFKTPAIVGIVLGLALAISVPAGMVIKQRFSPDNLAFEITEKINSENNATRVHVLFCGEMINEGGGKLVQVEGTVYIRDREGHIVYESDRVVFNQPLHSRDDSLSRGERWEMEVSVLTAPGDHGGIAIWNADMDDLEIVMEISELHYESDRFISFPNEDDLVIIKPFG